MTDFQHTEESTAGVPAEGLPGLQIHAGHDWKQGNKVRLRNLMIQGINSVPVGMALF